MEASRSITTGVPTIDALNSLSVPEAFLNSLTAESILAGEKLILFGRYILNFYVGIMHYILIETKTWHIKIYLPTQCTNWQILTSAQKIWF